MEELKHIDAKEVMNSVQTNFIFSSYILPEEKKDDLNIIYAFCRKTDDIVDDDKFTLSEKKIRLEKWNNELKKSFDSDTEFRLLKDLKNVKEKYNIPESPFFDLIKGMQLDLEQNRYKSFEELYQYCYYVASTVGLMTINLFGYTNKNTIDFAVNLGIALQLTNILRDIRKDCEAGRIYLPQEDLLKFGYGEDDLIANVYNDNFKSLMKSEVERTKNYYASAMKHLHHEDIKNMLPALIMRKTYYKILKKIESKNYNIFENKISISKFNKAFTAILTCIKYKLF